MSLGANLGDPLETIRAALKLLRLRLAPTDQRFALSRFFRTPPVGGPAGQPPFVNAVLAVDTSLTCNQVWQAIRGVEHDLGRQRDRRWEARRIDLDILLYEQQRIWTPHLKVPHPRMCMRRFILIPALDVAANWVDPVTQCTLAQLAEPLINGAASLMLVSQNAVVGDRLIADVARLSLATPVPRALSAGELQDRELQGRWLSAISPASLQEQSWQSSTLAKLLVFLSEPSSPPTETGTSLLAWEERHASLASLLRLAAGSDEVQDTASHNAWYEDSRLKSAFLSQGLPLVGPRYLLPGEDQAWAIHELVSALEAMDCPIEPLED